ncbi:DNA phosphorothioation system sulfurtransferase DndC [Labilibaculum euxinus]
MLKYSSRINHIISEITDQYLHVEDSNQPWIIGFSGGKDSTAVLQLVWLALQEIPSELRRREVFVVCNDTLVENPLIVNYVTGILNKIEKAAVQQGLPIKVIRTIPRLEDSYWVNVIGRGYPVPNNAFRWCTDRLKIRPTSRFILEKVSENGEAIVLIGTRTDESANRAKSIKKHAKRGSRLTKHPQLMNTFVYAPITNLMLEEVWYIVNAMPSAWDADNEELFAIYAEASADDYECPTMVTTDNHRSCGQSRFGCWNCTVVKEDKSMTAQIKNGYDWMKPLLDVRDSLVNERNILTNRMDTRRNGSKASNGMGTYTIDYRARILQQVLEAQKEVQKVKPEIELINKQELIAIQVIWNRDLYFTHQVSIIYNQIFNIDLDMKDHSERIQKEQKLLNECCKDNPEDYTLIQDLLTLQKSKSLLKRKRGLKEDIENRIDQTVNQKISE